MNATAAVEAHYTRPQLEQTILQALTRTGHDLQGLNHADLAAVDEFHVGGLEATQELAKFMKLRPGMHLLDVGCGIGGPARYFAGEQGCRVSGIDLTQEFVSVAENLSNMVGLAHAVEFRRASALVLPFDSDTFDGAYMIHVGMNIADKQGVFREVARVLKSGARFTLYEIVRASSGAFSFPVPWAMTEETSFVAEASAYREALNSAGFQVEHERGRREFALEFTRKVLGRVAEAGQPALGLQLLMGDKMPVMVGNMLAAMGSSVLEPIELVAVAQ
jgi:ubiquinone/menaquinone biosynthesis C-methylase UbiE